MVCPGHKHGQPPGHLEGFVVRYLKTDSLRDRHQSEKRPIADFCCEQLEARVLLSSLTIEPDPVMWGEQATFTATDPLGATGNPDLLERVGFWLDDGNGIWSGSQDTWIGGDSDADGGWARTNIVTQAYGTGSQTFFGVGRDASGWGTPFSADAMIVANDKPVIDEFRFTPDMTAWYEQVAMRAVGVRDPDGTVVRVGFFLDDGNGLWDGGDIDRPVAWASVPDAQGNWNAATKVQENWGNGDITFFAVGKDNDGGWGRPAEVSATIEVRRRPTVGRLLVTPDPVSWGHQTTFKGLGVRDTDGTVDRVGFFADANGNGHWDGGSIEHLVGWATEANSNGIWRIDRPAEMAWGSGDTSFFALAKDNDGLWGPAASVAVMIEENTLPVIDRLAFTPDPVTWGERARLIARGVRDADGAVDRVGFFQDANANGVWDGVGTERLIGWAEDASGNETWWLDAAVDTDWGTGDSAFFAIAEDDGMQAGQHVSVVATIEESTLPVIDGLHLTPDPVRWGEQLSMRAYGVRDPDGTVDRVGFFRDANANGQWDGVDVESLVGWVDQANSNDIWRLDAIVQPGWGSGDTAFFAVAEDNDEQLSTPRTAVITITDSLLGDDHANEGQWDLATSIGLDDDGSGRADGRIDHALDTDLFVFEAGATRAHGISLATPGSDLIGELRIFDSDHSLIATSEAGSDPWLALDLVAGERYFVLISGAPTLGLIGAYQLEIAPM
jgi:hypothetical protein